MNHILDNPIYNALNTAHSIYAEGNDSAKFYTKDITSFAGLKNNSPEDLNALYDMANKDEIFIFFKPTKIDLPAKWNLITHIDMLQLVYDHTTFPTGNHAFSDLKESHIEAMIELVKLTKPGPFLNRTIELGNYTGFFEGDDLVSMAGHRFNPTPYTEISAVCTHPDHLGKGYSYSLLCEQVKRILNKSEIPFLHVRNDNVGAIKLYEKVGFVIRTEMIAYVIQK
jgi:ribosomal protein S18 acetylase RimI-like enzyme